MRSSRTPQSLSSVSSRSYMSERTRPRSGSSRRSDDAKKPTRKIKFIIAIGIALPIIAAIIGIVAWAVSADSAFHGPVANSLRRSDIHIENPEEDIFQALEDRHDVEYSKHFPEANHQIEKHFSDLDKGEKPDFSRFDNANSHNQFDDNPSKDPLYIVHFVPSPKPKVESSTGQPNLASTVSNEVLQKILSASKGTKPGTPQFVVFAPVPEEDEAKEEEAGTLQIGSRGTNSLSNHQLPNGEIDYDYEEELRKYQELVDSTGHPPHKETSRVGQTKDITKAQAETLKETVRLLTQNLTARNAYQSHSPQLLLPSSNSIHQGYNPNQHQLLQQPQQQIIIPQQNIQQPYQSPSQGYQQDIPQRYAHQPVEQSPNYAQYQQNYAPQEANYANQQAYPQPQATARSGQYEPVGIKLSLGTGNNRGLGLLGGNYSPLGIIGSILRPILPRPQVNLNGKVMFGVMLDSGVKLGGDNKAQSYG